MKQRAHIIEEEPNLRNNQSSERGNCVLDPFLSLFCKYWNASTHEVTLNCIDKSNGEQKWQPQQWKHPRHLWVKTLTTSSVRWRPLRTCEFCQSFTNSGRLNTYGTWLFSRNEISEQSADCGLRTRLDPRDKALQLFQPVINNIDTAWILRHPNHPGSICINIEM